MDDDPLDSDDYDSNSNEEFDEEILKAMEEMDEELASNPVGKSFDGHSVNDEAAMQINLIRNFMESYKSQTDASGPVSSMMHDLLRKRSNK